MRAMGLDDRRTFLKVSALTGASVLTELATGSSAQAQSAPPAAKSVETSVLSIAYEEAGDPNGFPIILLHGFPDDVRAFDEVVPPLTKAGFRTLVPYLRGYGPTRFRDPAAPRMAEQAAIGQDVIDFADALRAQRFAVSGYDWGGRAAAIAAALHPDRVRATVLIGGYTVQNTIAPQPPGAAAAEHRLWYQYYFNTERGRAGLQSNRHEICRYLWQQWSPSWHFTDDTYQRTAPSFDNPDFVDVVIHSYRHRIMNAPGSHVSRRSKSDSQNDRGFRLLQSPCMVPRMASRGHRWSHHPRNVRHSNTSSLVASFPGWVTSCRANGRRRCRQRCSNCWRRQNDKRSRRVCLRHGSGQGRPASTTLLRAHRFASTPTIGAKNSRRSTPLASSKASRNASVVTDRPKFLRV